ncbi:sugar phosphate isomerase/epimerase family protein [Ktedonobacter racemifer]|uniref:Xylose isomerase domain protein TIM barrel n=1 Tax=Ktedonobacter racemifer DSM 44963 TaxID=485913 RepID=D6U4S3_KTERA|nr:TIM barrel protein [Ktedonobacter racemifer]EFH81503.1 Xylose isomerase domain protein TIM barrel [Ktedonobacter racemifer DSM 44963]
MQTNNQSARVSVSTWSLHRTLGGPAFYGVGDPLPADTHNKGAYSLLALPERLVVAGISTMEICHFHLPTLDPGYLGELRAALEAAQVELFSLLVDDGDITHPTNGERDLAWIRQWLDVAQALGARCMRVIAGKSAPSPQALERSYQALSILAAEARERDVRLMTENWFALLSTPQSVQALFERLNGEVGLCLDFGNWKGHEKYAALEEIAPLAESCHAKASFDSPYVLDQEDYLRCLDITRLANFSGPYTLIYDGPDQDEWKGLANELAVAQQYVQ